MQGIANTATKRAKCCLASSIHSNSLTSSILASKVKRKQRPCVLTLYTSHHRALMWHWLFAEVISFMPARNPITKRRLLDIARFYFLVFALQFQMVCAKAEIAEIDLRTRYRHPRMLYCVLFLTEVLIGSRDVSWLGQRRSGKAAAHLSNNVTGTSTLFKCFWHNCILQGHVGTFQNCQTLE